MGDGGVERFHRLAGEGAAACVGDGAGDHEWDFAPHLCEDGLNAKNGRFCIQRVENRFDQQDVRAAIHQSPC